MFAAIAAPRAPAASVPAPTGACATRTPAMARSTRTLAAALAGRSTYARRRVRLDERDGEEREHASGAAATPKRRAQEPREERDARERDEVRALGAPGDAPEQALQPLAEQREAREPRRVRGVEDERLAGRIPRAAPRTAGGSTRCPTPATRRAPPSPARTRRPSRPRRRSARVEHRAAHRLRLHVRVHVSIRHPCFAEPRDRARRNAHRVAHARDHDDGARVGRAHQRPQHHRRVLEPARSPACADHRVVDWWYRGHGKSESARSKDYAIATHADDLRRVTEARATRATASALRFTWRSRWGSRCCSSSIARAPSSCGRWCSWPAARTIRTPRARSFAFRSRAPPFEAELRAAAPIVPALSPITRRVTRRTRSFPLARSWRVGEGAPREEVERFFRAVGAIGSSRVLGDRCAR